jgi:hypothetical protein
MPSFNTHLRTIFAKTDWPSVLKGNELSPIVVFAMLVNGINVPREELFGSAQKMYAMLGGSCPTTGFHNASHGLPSDWNRIKLEFDRKDTISVVGLRQVLCEAMDYFASVCPNFLLFLVGHSEGGLIIYNAIRGMDETHCAMARKHLMIRTYGSIQFIPDDYGSNVNNTCSEKDSAASYARGKYASCGSVPNGCTVTEVPCISSLLERSWPGGPDHNFGEPTYLKALRDDIDRVRDRHVFIYSKNR